MKDPYGRRGRLLCDIAEYDFKIQHIDGSVNLLADALSRFGHDKLPENSVPMLAPSTPVEVRDSPTSVNNIQMPLDSEVTQVGEKSILKNSKHKMEIFHRLSHGSQETP